MLNGRGEGSSIDGEFSPSVSTLGERDLSAVCGIGTLISADSDFELCAYSQYLITKQRLKAI